MNASSHQTWTLPALPLCSWQDFISAAQRALVRVRMHGVKQLRLRSDYELKLLWVCDICLWSAGSQENSNFLFVVGYCCSMYRSCRLLPAVAISRFCSFIHRQISRVWSSSKSLPLLDFSSLTQMLCADSHTFLSEAIVVPMLTCKLSAQRNINSKSLSFM